jgi:hypothetical protein
VRLRHWLCMWLPWHGLIHSFWASPRVEVMHCHRCGLEWALNHEIEAVLPFEGELKDFHRERGFT